MTKGRGFHTEGLHKESLGAKMHEATFGMVYQVIPEFEVRDILKCLHLKELY